MNARQRTPIPDLRAPPSPSTPGDTPRRESIKKVLGWREKLGELQDQVEATIKVLEDLEPMLATEVAQQHRFPVGAHLNEVTALQRTLKDALTKAKQISATNWSDLSMVGVHPDEQTMSATSLHERLVENLRNTDAKYCAEAKVCSENLFMDYRVWRRALNYKTEAAVRTHVDCTIRQMLPLSENTEVDYPGPGKSILCPELALSNSLENTKLRTQSDQQRLISLNGRSDYTQIYVPSWAEMDHNRQAQAEDHLKNIKIVKSNGETFTSDAGLEQVCLTIIEAKRAASNGDQLLSYIPQAVAEALVLSLRSQPAGQPPLTVPFILTNAFEWIFGFLRKRESFSDQDPGWECCRTELYRIPEQGLKDTATAQEEEETKEALGFVLDMLLQWNCADRMRIMQNAGPLLSRSNGV